MAKETERGLYWSNRRTLSLELLEDRQLLSGMNFPGNSQVFFPTRPGAASPLAVVQSESQPEVVLPGTLPLPPQQSLLDSGDLSGPAGNGNPHGQNGVPANSSPGGDNAEPDSRAAGTTTGANPSSAKPILDGAGVNTGAADQTPGDSEREPYKVPTDQQGAALAMQYLAEQPYQQPQPYQQALVQVVREQPRPSNPSTGDNQLEVDPPAPGNAQAANLPRVIEVALPAGARQGAPSPRTAAPQGTPVFGETWYAMRVPPQAGELTTPDGEPGGQLEAATIPPPVSWTVSLAPLKGPLLAGLLPFDLAAFEHGVQKFLAQLENLGQYLTDPQMAARAAPWLLALVGGAAAAWDFSRRRRNKRNPHWRAPEAGWIDPGRTWLPGLAVFRQLEESNGSGTA
jgi:hypothetical protein